MKLYNFGQPEDPAEYLPDEVFRAASGGFILVAVDVVLCNQGGIFLAKRSIEPARDLWWVFGGRVRPFEYFQDAARRHLKTDLNLCPRSEKLIALHLTPMRIQWPVRQQDPQSVGADYITTHVFCLTVSTADVVRAGDNLNPNEYDRESGLRFISWGELRSTDLNPYIKDIASSAQKLAKST